MNNGRDHYPAVYSLLMAGGGVRGGHVHGSSDPGGRKPATAPCTPADVHATAYRALGIDHHAELQDEFGRPFYSSTRPNSDFNEIFTRQSISESEYTALTFNRLRADENLGGDGCSLAREPPPRSTFPALPPPQRGTQSRSAPLVCMGC